MSTARARRRRLPLLPPDRARARTYHPARHGTESLERGSMELPLSEHPEVGHGRPRTLGECRSVGYGTVRACPWVSCGHHLALEITPAGSVRVNFPGLDPDGMRASCALAVADVGGTTLEEVGASLNLTRERTRQIEYHALKKVRAACEALGLRLEDLWSL